MIGVKIFARNDARQIPWPEGAVFGADFANGRYLRNGKFSSAGEAFDFARPSTGLAQDRAGVFHAFTGDEPRIVNGLGLFLEPASTNKVPNNSMTGAQRGVVGAGGALPTGWAHSTTFDSLTVVDFGVGSDGLPFIDLTLEMDRTALDSGFPQIYFGGVGDDSIPALPNQPLCGSAWYEILTKDPTDSVTVVYQVVETYTEENAGLEPTFTDLPNETGHRMHAISFNEGTGETVARVRHRYQAQVMSGLKLHRTIRVTAPQLEPDRTTPTSPILTGGDPATRAADALLLHAGNSSNLDWVARYDNGSETVIETARIGDCLIQPGDLATPLVTMIWARNSI